MRSCAARPMSCASGSTRGSRSTTLLPEAFATVREATKRVLGKRPYDVQVVGGVALHRCNIAEMKTGEGKTIVAPLRPT